MFFIFDIDDFFEHSYAGVALIVGFILAAIFEIEIGAELCHQANIFVYLLISLILIIQIAVKSIKDFNSSRKIDKIFSIVDIAVITGCLIYGFINRTGPLEFKYQFRYRIISAIQYASLPSIIIWIILDIKEQIKMKSFDKGILFLYFLLFIGFIISIVVICLIILLIGLAVDRNEKIEQFLGIFMYYYNEDYEINRDKFDTPLEMANLALQEYKQSLIDAGGDPSKITISEMTNYSEFRKTFLVDKYGFDAKRYKKLVDENYQYTICDLAYKTEYILVFDVNEICFKEYTGQQIAN